MHGIKYIGRILIQIGSPILFLIKFFARILFFLARVFGQICRWFYLFFRRFLIEVKASPKKWYRNWKKALLISKRDNVKRKKIEDKNQKRWLKEYLLRQKKKEQVVKKPWIKIDWVYFGLTITTGLLTMAMVWFYGAVIRDLPNTDEIYNPPKLSTKINDRNGQLLYKFYNGENRSWIKISEVPKSLIDATLAIEDKDFYKHHGVSIKGIIQAVVYNLKNPNQGLHGGSTITQQLVKNVFFSNEKTFERKLKEIIVAVLVEGKLTKDEILERYFNQIPYGGEVYGAAEAAEKYFGKKVGDLTIAESAYIAGLTAAPSSYSPFGRNKDLAKYRQKNVIEQMVSAGFIDEETGLKAYQEELKINTKNKSILAPHFVFYVRDYLREKFDYQNVERRGLTVTTTIDMRIQTMAEKMVKEELDKIKQLKITNGAALVLDIKNGEILAMVGSKGYNAEDIDGKYNVVLAQRQPGSSIKPINYLLALKNGKTLSSIVDDEPVTYVIPGQKPYSPQNYNGKYMGPVTIKTALASSLNIPSVKLLAENGVDNMIDLAERMGISTWNDRNRYGLSLALGGGEVTMLELAGAYSIFARLGEKVEYSPIKEIDNYLGENIFKPETRIEGVVVEPEYAFLINQALSDNKARAPVFGLNSKLNIAGKTVAVKTGTTNNLKDNWCIGWTPNYLVAVWVGNNDSTPMSWVASGVSGATPIWNRIMSELIRDTPNEEWVPPSRIIKKNICGREEYIIEGTEKEIKCQLTPTPTPIGISG